MRGGGRGNTLRLGKKRSVDHKLSFENHPKLVHDKVRPELSPHFSRFVFPLITP